MANDFLNAKYDWLFRFFDTSNNGILEMDDFESRAYRASNAVQAFFLERPNGRQILDNHMESIRNAQLQVHRDLFQQLLKVVRTAAPNKITRTEWFNFCHYLRQEIERTGRLPEWFERLLRFYFEKVLDFNGNGSIDFYEMTFMGDAPVDVTWYCYDKLTDSNQKPLNLDLFLDMTKRYMSSNNPADPSRYMFGFIGQP